MKSFPKSDPNLSLCLPMLSSGCSQGMAGRYKVPLFIVNNGDGIFRFYTQSCLIFGSDMSPRRGIVCLCVHVIMVRMTLKEFLMHSKGSRRVLSKQARKQASK